VISTLERVGILESAEAATRPTLYVARDVLNVLERGS